MGTGKKWSARVTRMSHALDLEKDVFKGSARSIALSLKRSVVRSRRRKGTPYRSAMSMLSFYKNRAGKKLPAEERQKLERAKGILKRLFMEGGKKKQAALSGEMNRKNKNTGHAF